MAGRTLWSHTPLSWDDLRRVLAAGALEKLVRSHELCMRYNDATEQMLTEYASVGDYILSREFGFATEPGEDGRRAAVAPPAFTRAVAWAPNDFPYFFEAGMEHHILWCAGGALSDDELAEHIEKHRPAARYEVQLFVNPKRLQSVTNVWHAHVISRPRAAPPPSQDG